MTHILGLNSFHGDSAACLLTDGRIVAAAEEERFTRVKHWAGFPQAAIRYCLSEAGLRLEDIDRVAVNHDSRANRWARLAYVARTRPRPGAILDRLRRRRQRADLASHFERSFGAAFRGPVDGIEHHECHLASAFFGSRFAESLAVSVDGFGDFASTAWGVGRDANVAIERRILYPHSLGIFYQALTQYLGFPDYGDEYKVMGLAPYGEPRHVEAMRRLVRLLDDGGFRLDLDYFRHADGNLELAWSDGAPRFASLFSPALEDLLGPARAPAAELTQRHRDLASSVQAVYEEAFFHVLRHAQASCGMEDLVLAGGCAQNSVANGKILRATPIRRTYVQPASGDAGGAAGAAMASWARLAGARPRAMDHAYLGPGFDDAQLAASLEARGAELHAESCTQEHLADEGALCGRIAALIAQGRVVGWFQGRMEWGPRALGNRSILCDPRRADMKELLNAKIKRRESFRPFAPSVLREAVADWFTVDDDVPFMTHVYPVREERRALVPAVTHVDGSGRLQTVSAQDNPRFHRLIAAFRDLTGVPMLLNTSFNESEPIVCTPAQALDCFVRTRMDCLVLGDRVVSRPFGGPS